MSCNDFYSSHHARFMWLYQLNVSVHLNSSLAHLLYFCLRYFQMPMGYNPYPYGQYNMPNMPYMPYQGTPGQGGYPAAAPPAGQPYPGYPQQPPQQQPYYPQQ